MFGPHRGLRKTFGAEPSWAGSNMFGPGAETGLPVPMAAARRNFEWGAAQCWQKHSPRVSSQGNPRMPTHFTFTQSATSRRSLASRTQQISSCFVSTSRGTQHAVPVVSTEPCQEKELRSKIFGYEALNNTERQRLWKASS